MPSKPKKNLQLVPVPNVDALNNLLRSACDAEIINMGVYTDYPQAVNVCPTPACILGHYASRRDLQQSFRLRTGRRGVWYGAASVGYDSPAVLKHFGITALQGVKLFSGPGCANAYNDKAAVIQFLRGFIAGITG